MSTFSVFGLSYDRSDIEFRVLTLFRASKYSVVICRASLLYKMSCLFRSTLFVTTDFPNSFHPNWNVNPDRAAAFPTCLVNATWSKHINREHSWLLKWKNQYVRKTQCLFKISFGFLRWKHHKKLKKSNSVYSFITNKICNSQTLRSDGTYWPWKVSTHSVP